MQINDNIIKQITTTLSKDYNISLLYKEVTKHPTRIQVTLATDSLKVIDKNRLHLTYSLFKDKLRLDNISVNELSRGDGLAKTIIAILYNSSRNILETELRVNRPINKEFWKHMKQKHYANLVYNW